MRDIVEAEEEAGYLHTSAYVSIRQHTSAYVSIRQHPSAYVSIRQHTSAFVSIRARPCIRTFLEASSRGMTFLRANARCVQEVKHLIAINLEHADADVGYRIGREPTRCPLLRACRTFGPPLQEFLSA